MILDCDLLIGRDISTGDRQCADELAVRLRAAGIAGGAVGSLRSLLFHAESGNEEARSAGREHDWLPVAGIDLRDPLGAEREICRAADAGVPFVRMAPARQGIAGSAPRIRALARRCTERDLTLLVEGSTVELGSSFMGLGCSVVFLDQHFYDLGEFILLARGEPGFHLSTRLLGSPEAWEIAIAGAGAERLVFGSRAGWFEERSVLERLRTARLTHEQRELVTAGNLTRLAGRS
jgi:predicted TIM-barrel fold metal-dependent hydrolase